MKKQFILTVIVTICILSILNGQNSKNFNNKFLENKNHQHKTELQKENHTAFSSNKRDIKDIQLHLKETNVYTKKLDSIVRYKYDDINNQLLPYSLYEYTYDANNNLTSEIYSLWDTSTNSWINYYKYEYTYDANNNVTSEIYSEWDTSINSLINDSKCEYTYDANNNVTSEITSYWDTNTNSWIYGNKYEYTYDMMVSIDNVLVPYAFESNNPILSYFYYEYDGSNFVLDMKEIYYYSDITGINEVTDNYNVSIYPNPANDYL